jgi:hypothetical protein
MDLTNIQFGNDPLELAGYQVPSHYTPQTEYQNPIPNNHFYYYQPSVKEKSSPLKKIGLFLGITAIIMAIIIWLLPKREIEKTLALNDKKSWDLEYIEAKKKQKKARFKKDVGWVIYK